MLIREILVFVMKEYGFVDGCEACVKAEVRLELVRKAKCAFGSEFSLSIAETRVRMGRNCRVRWMECFQGR